MNSLENSLKAFLGDIKIAHSIFALPFAISAVIIVRQDMRLLASQGGGLREILAFLVAMVAARSFAMGMNRYLDWRWDAANPRTQRRAIPRGSIDPSGMFKWSMVFAVIFVMATYALNAQIVWMAFPLLVILASYSYFKRFTWLTHWYLGLCLALAPIAAQVAVAGRASDAGLAMAAGVMFWTAGFDLIYSLQDIGFDREAGLHSFPARFGARTTLWVSRGCFVVALLFWRLMGHLQGVGGYYLVGLCVIGLVLVLEHVLVRHLADAAPDKEINIHAAFFNCNALIGIVFVVSVFVDEYMRGLF